MLEGAKLNAMIQGERWVSRGCCGSLPYYRIEQSRRFGIGRKWKPVHFNS